MLGGIGKPETLDNENKEFIIHIRSDMNKLFQKLYTKSLMDYSSKLVMNNLITYSLEKTLLKYFPKYLGNFSTAGISGKLNIGIDDNGIIEGVPYFGNLTIDQESLYQRVLMQIDFQDKSMCWLKENVHISINCLEINEYMIDEQWKIRLDELLDEHRIKQFLWKEYVMKYKEWYNVILKYSRKVNLMINNPIIRKEFCDESGEVLQDIPIILMIEDEDISSDKWEIVNPELLEKFVVFKNKKLFQIHSLKPIRPTRKVTEEFNYVHFAQRMCNIRHILHQNNFNFYTITIHFKSNIPISYLDIRSNSFVMKKRIVNDGEPCCIEIE